MLNIVKKIEIIIKDIKPSIIYTHFFGDLNIDHQKTFEAVNVVCRPIKKMPVKKILCFEILSRTEWVVPNKKQFNPNYFLNINNEIKKKINAFKIYKDEVKKYPHSRSLIGIKSLAMYRGIQSGNNYAEAFYLAKKLN